LVEWELAREENSEKTYPSITFPPKIQPDLTWDWTRAATVSSDNKPPDLWHGPVILHLKRDNSLQKYINRQPWLINNSNF
jgi:hypothetical protein